MHRSALLQLTALVLAGCTSPVTMYLLPPEETPAPATSSSAGSARPPYESPGGMWLPEELDDEQRDTLRSLGLEIGTSELADPMGYPLGAVVSLGGCSASFVSAEGLVATNHHCVTSALQYNSTPEQNLIENGFLAKTRADEKSVGPTGRVYVTLSFSDVTDRVDNGIEQIADPQKRFLEIEARTKTLLAECEKDRPALRCDVASFDGGSRYLLIEKLQIKDVRLVYAPHVAVGDFGGEIDNWRWPRHADDFALYRAYVAPDGKPAEYAASNVPYKPRRYLRLASKPLGAGDLVLAAGYPARTFRLVTFAELSEAVDWSYPRQIERAKDYLTLVEALGKDDADLRIKAEPFVRGLNNGLTYTRGALEGLTRGGGAKSKAALESDLKTYIAADPERQKRYGDVTAKLDALFAERKRTRDADAALDELLSRSALLRAAMTIVRMAEERPKPDAEREPDYQQRNWEMIEQGQRAFEKRYSRKLDMALFVKAALNAARLPDEQSRPLLEPLVGKAELKKGAPGEPALRRAIERLYSATSLEKTETRLLLLRTATTAALRRSADGLMRLALAWRPLVKDEQDRDQARSGELALLRPRYIAALREMSSTPLGSDANGTLRVSYGTVHGYRPIPQSKPYRPFTLASEVVTKTTGKPPFHTPARLLEALRARKLGPYVDARLGDIPVDFLSDCDTTGGNSGSPTLNARGELVGLVFDGNYESMASDWLFIPDITRSIHVDIRYVLWVMDAVDGADALLTEMGVEPAIE